VQKWLSLSAEGLVSLNLLRTPLERQERSPPHACTSTGHQAIFVGNTALIVSQWCHGAQNVSFALIHYRLEQGFSNGPCEPRAETFTR